jgi:hypothetical protein
VWSYTLSSNYRRLQTLQSKCLRIIGNLHRCTHIPLLHTTFNVLPIHEQIHYMTARFFDTPPITQIPLYVLSETTTYEISINNTKSTSLNKLNRSSSKLLLKTTCRVFFPLCSKLSLLSHFCCHRSTNRQLPTRAYPLAN